MLSHARLARPPPRDLFYEVEGAMPAHMYACDRGGHGGLGSVRATLRNQHRGAARSPRRCGPDLFLVLFWTAAFRIGGLERTLDALRRIPQLVRNRVAQQLRGRDDARRDERKQERILDRGNGIFVRPKFFRNFRILIIVVSFLTALSVDFAR